MKPSRNGNDEPIPPETSTSMPPCLHYIYDRSRGWPGRLEDFRPDNPGKTRTDPALAFRRWLRRD
jgi:hypothetical protein